MTKWKETDPVLEQSESSWTLIGAERAMFSSWEAALSGLAEKIKEVKSRGEKYVVISTRIDLAESYSTSWTGQYDMHGNEIHAGGPDCEYDYFYFDEREIIVEVEFVVQQTFEEAYPEIAEQRKMLCLTD